MTVRSRHTGGKTPSLKVNQLYRFIPYMYSTPEELAIETCTSYPSAAASAAAVADVSVAF